MNKNLEQEKTEETEASFFVISVGFCSKTSVMLP
jgi:hypothetical protein